MQTGPQSAHRRDRPEWSRRPRGSGGCHLCVPCSTASWVQAFQRSLCIPFLVLFIPQTPSWPLVAGRTCPWLPVSLHSDSRPPHVHPKISNLKSTSPQLPSKVCVIVSPFSTEEAKGLASGPQVVMFKASPTLHLILGLSAAPSEQGSGVGDSLA